MGYIKEIITCLSNKLAESISGFISYHFFSKKNLVFILGSMRSGSTLLKALLAEAQDVSNLPEVKLGAYSVTYGKYTIFYKLSKLSKKRVIIIKNPAFFYCPRYPDIQINRARIIVLFRDPCDTVISLQNVIKLPFQSEEIKNLGNKELVNYWVQVYENIVNNKKLMNNNRVVFVKYEDLLKEPEKITEKLFKFIGSKQRFGVASYKKPDNYEWKWGKDDGGDKIKTLKVLEKTKYDKNRRREVLKIINSSSRIKSLMARLNNNTKRIM
ncbi:MAG: sulfotransferase [Deltaproteobacteria bacterium]|nr:sulfotransferase [Deltaproteobacteria bacterium]